MSDFKDRMIEGIERGWWSEENAYDACRDSYLASVRHDSVRFSEVELVKNEVVESNVKIIPRSAIAKCPHVILVASHYREDGTCKCDDPDEQEMMIREWGYSKEDFNADL